jgi:hypothetical protein
MNSDPQPSTDRFGNILDIQSYISHYMQTPTQSKMPELKPVLDVNDANAFWLHKGGPIKNVVELKKAFDSMTQEQFDFHFNKNKNDFSLWVHHVLKDEKCAENLTRATTRKGASRIMFKNLKRYDVQQYN